MKYSGLYSECFTTIYVVMQQSISKQLIMIRHASRNDCLTYSTEQNRYGRTTDKNSTILLRESMYVLGELS